MAIKTGEDWQMGAVDPDRHIKVELKNENQQDKLLLHIAVTENKKTYRHDEVVGFDVLDYFMIVHISGWLARGFQIELDRNLYDKLYSTKKLFTKRMLRNENILEKVKIY